MFGALGITRPQRLAALAKTGLLDSPPEELFDRWTQLICDLLETPGDRLKMRELLPAGNPGILKYLE